MRTYHVNVKFRAWRPGDVFQSADPAYVEMAAEGKLLTELTRSQSEDEEVDPEWRL